MKWGENHLLLTPKVEHAMLWELTGAVGVISLFHRGCGQKRRPGCAQWSRSDDSEPTASLKEMLRQGHTSGFLPAWGFQLWPSQCLP